MSRHEAPRKVVVGTCIYPMYSSQNPWPELDGRLGQLAGLIDDMAEEAEATYGSGGLDLAALPEVAVNGGLNGDAESVSFPFRGAHVPCRGGGGRMVSSGRMTPARPIRGHDRGAWVGAGVAGADAQPCVAGRETSRPGTRPVRSECQSQCRERGTWPANCMKCLS